MYSYRHQSHAGNHADAFKHGLLVAMLHSMNEQNEPWCYLESHAGAGLYDLGGQVGNTFRTGIGRLWQRPDLPEWLGDYVGLVRDLNLPGELLRYPGSPWLASRIMRDGGRLHLFEADSAEARRLRRLFADANRNVTVETSDGLAGLKTILPSFSHRAAVLIDPPYTSEEEYARVLRTLEDALDRFAANTYAVWYPRLQMEKTHRFADRLKSLPVESWLQASLSVRSPRRSGMHGSGLFVANPPERLTATLALGLPWLAGALGEDATADYQLESQENG